MHERHFKAEMILGRVMLHLAQQFEPGSVAERALPNLAARGLVCVAASRVQREYEEFLKSEGAR